jgi:hypothetical protein
MNEEKCEFCLHEKESHRNGLICSECEVEVVKGERLDICDEYTAVNPAEFQP